MTKERKRLKLFPVRYRLWHLFIVVTVAAVLFGWYAYRIAYIQAEARAIVGDWVMVDQDGNTYLDASGEPFGISISPDEFVINPFTEPKRIDFITSNGTSRAIYRWDKGRLRVLQASEGLSRPRTFDDKITDLKDDWRVPPLKSRSLADNLFARPPKQVR